MTGSPRTAAALIAGTTLVALLTTVAAAGPTGSPRVMPTVGINAQLTAVAVPPTSSDIFAVSNTFESGVTLPDTVIHRRNGHWSIAKLHGVPATANLRYMAAGSTKVAWVAGANYDNATLVRTPVIAESTGKAFKAFTLPGFTEGSIIALAASSPKNAWAVGSPAAAGTTDSVSTGTATSGS